jgi:hypothetical protein
MRHSALPLLSAAFMLCVLVGAASAAPVTCVAVQVNEGEKPPPSAAYRAVLSTGGCVRDVLGWHQVEREPGRYVIPRGMAENYQNAAAAGLRNLVTLAFGNEIYGANGFQGKPDPFLLPTTPEQVEAFKRYAVWVASNDGGASPDATAANIPNLYGVSIWNELNGSWPGGIKNVHDRLSAYAKLVDAVGPAVRQANPNIKIIVGATIGVKVADWFKELFVADKMWGLNDPAVYLDVHLYLGGGLTPANPVVPGVTAWNTEMKTLRDAGVRNALFASEWGGWVGDKVETANPGVDYMTWAQSNIFDHENFAGTAWFELIDFGKFGKAGLVDIGADGGVERTKLGKEFVQWWTSSAR